MSGDFSIENLDNSRIYFYSENFLTFSFCLLIGKLSEESLFSLNIDVNTQQNFTQSENVFPRNGA